MDSWEHWPTARKRDLESQVAFHNAGGGGVRPAWPAEVAPEPASELLWIARALRVRWKLVALLTTALVAVAVYAAGSIVPLYSATATILIDPGQTEYTDLRSSPGARQNMVWPADMESYIKVLWSDWLAADVVRSIGPGSFHAQPGAFGWLRAQAAAGLDPLRDWIARYLDAEAGLPRLQLHDAGALASSGLAQTIEVFRQNLQVERDSLAATLLVTYHDADPAVAARVANATAEAFPKELVRVQESALVATTDYLRERVTALQHELETAESQTRVLQNEIAKPDGSSIARARFGEIIRTLSDAEAEITSLRSDIAEAGGGNGQPVSDRLASPMLQELRLQKLQLAREVAEFGTGVGERHPQMVALLAKNASVQTNIRDEEVRIRGQLQRALRASEAKVAWLRGELALTEDAMARGMDDEVKLRQLETKTESTRQVYQDILSRYQRASEQQRMVRPPARVINVAQRPEQPERRRIHLALAAAALGSLTASAALALTLELRRKGFRLSGELAATTGQPVHGSLPLVAAGLRHTALAGAWRSSRRQQYAEAISRLALHVLPPGTRRPGLGAVVLVTSAVPAEGKSVASLSLARQLAETGHKVLLVDGDLHKCTLQRLLDLPELVDRRPRRRVARRRDWL